MANTSTIHIKTDFDCKVYDYGQELGTTKADTYFNVELRKGEHELTFVYMEDESISKAITYEVKDADCDYRIIVEIGKAICNKAKEYYDVNNYSSAYKLFGFAAARNDADAQFYIGNIVLDDGTTLGAWIEAVSWWSKAAEQGHAKAQCQLASCYENETGVDFDPVRAVELFTKSAEQGDEEAQRKLLHSYYVLGSSYENGAGVVKDFNKAIEWYTKAAEHGDVNAQYNLGRCYYEGKGVERNLYEAIEWYKKAEKQGVEVGIELSCCYDELTN